MFTLRDLREGRCTMEQVNEEIAAREARAAQIAKDCPEYLQLSSVLGELDQLVCDMSDIMDKLRPTAKSGATKVLTLALDDVWRRLQSCFDNDAVRMSEMVQRVAQEISGGGDPD